VNILIAPLDWGLGHATRCVPIINKLIEHKTNVFIAADKRPYDFLKKEFPKLKFIKLPGYDITYPKNNNMAGKILLSIPRIIRRIKKEHKILKSIIKENNIDIIISDNRYGLWNKKIKSVFMTHQLMVKCPKGFKFCEPIFYFISKYIIKKYDECWIPDYEGKINLSGDLSHKYKIPSNAHFIGPLSHFHDKNIDDEIFINEEFNYELLVILSGPEPQRTILESKIFKQLENIELKTVVIKGITEKYEEYEFNDFVKVFSHLKTEKIIDLILKSKIVLCRPGYSSIMDLTSLGKDAIFIPTPGQTEQEYLAKNFMDNKIFSSITQNEFNLKNAIEQSSSFTGVKLNYNPSLLEERIENLLKN